MNQNIFNNDERYNEKDNTMKCYAWNNETKEYQSCEIDCDKYNELHMYAYRFWDRLKADSKRRRLSVAQLLVEKKNCDLVVAIDIANSIRLIDALECRFSSESARELNRKK